MQFKYLLLTRFIVLNVFFTSLVLAVYGQGWLDAMITARLVELTPVSYTHLTLPTIYSV